MNLRSTFSLDVADLVRSGFSVGEALRRVLVMQDGSGPRKRTTDVLADLQDMGVWSPDPDAARAERYDNPSVI